MAGRRPRRHPRNLYARPGTADPPSVVATTTQALYAPGLVTNTTYYWTITATDGLSFTAGPLWQFTTVADERRVYLPAVLRTAH